MNAFDKEIKVSLQALQRAVGLFHSLNTVALEPKTKVSISDEIEEVTDIDIRINQDIAEFLAEHFPEDMIIGEENSILPRGAAGGRLWLIDPIDGTRSLVNQVKGYSTMIAFVHEGRPTVGCIWDARSDQIFIAVRGGGMHRVVGRRLEKFGSRRKADLKLLWNPYNPNILRHRRLKRHLVENLKLSGVLEVESCGLRGLHIAMKEGVLMLSRPNSAKLWDTAAGHVFIGEAGGSYTDLRGGQLSYSPDGQVHTHGAIATVDFDHRKALECINSCLATTRCYG